MSRALFPSPADPEKNKPQPRCSPHPRAKHPWLLLLVGLAVLIPASAVSAGDEPGLPKKVRSIEGVTEYSLANGLRVLLYPDDSTPKVTVNLTVMVGSRHEGYGETGMAHLLEHMLFKGTPTHPKIPKVLNDHGADYNATTWYD